MNQPRSRFIRIEVSIEDSESARLAYEFYAGDGAVSNDPFDIAADREEQQGEPLYHSRKEEDMRLPDI